MLTRDLFLELAKRLNSAHIAAVVMATINFGTIPRETIFLVLVDIIATSIGIGHSEKATLVTVIGAGGVVLLSKDTLVLWNDVFGWITKHPKGVIKGQSFNK